MTDLRFIAAALCAFAVRAHAQAPTPTPAPATAQAPDVSEPAEAAPPAPPAEPATEEATGEEIVIVDTTPPGAKAEIKKEQLEREEHDDLHKVLRGVAGVYLRDEDGYGLR